MKNKETRKPTVSVVMATYNGEKYIREQIDSILNQSYPIHELIIQDDCSTDSTPDICREYEAKHHNVHFFENANNLGFNENFRTASMRATGDFIAISDQDDVWFPEKIEKQVKTIGEHDICFCCHKRGQAQEHAAYVTPQYSLEALLFTGFAGHTMLLRRDFIQNKNNWISYIHYDWSLAINAQLSRGIIRIDEPLNWHRSHEGSAIDEEQKRFHKEFNKKLTWQPYIYGWKNYFELQRKTNWQKLYTFIYNRTSQDKQPLAHEMSRLMLKKGIIPLLHLCWLCMIHRSSIYWNGNAKGLLGRIRSFAYPLIFTVNNVQFDL